VVAGQQRIRLDLPSRRTSCRADATPALGDCHQWADNPHAERTAGDAYQAQQATPSEAVSVLSIATEADSALAVAVP
jgi:hypothetical protein